jgi:hypothetical protein
MFTVIANASDEGAGVHINLGIIVPILAVFVLIVVAWQHHSRPRR